MRFRNMGIVLAALSLLLVGCGGDATDSDEYQALEEQHATAQSQVDDLTAELSEVRADLEVSGAMAEVAAGRHEKAKATQETAFAIIEDPSAFGTEEDVLDLLDEMAVPATVYGDAAFGPIGWRAGWRNTLFGQVDATIRTWASWLSEDGSVGGSLWTWSGTARNGEPFDLEGIELSTYDENGLYSSLMVHYPYVGTEVMRTFMRGNTTDSDR